MKLKKAVALTLGLVLLALLLTACSYPRAEKSEKVEKIAMITDTGGLFDASFNQSSWEGLNFLKDKHSEISLTYLEPMQETDFITGMDLLCDGGNDLVVASGAALTGAIVREAKLTPEKRFLLCDCTVDDIPQNLTTMTFRAEESGFLVGYIAGMNTKTNKVGFIGGMDNPGAYQYQYGYMAGVLYASKQRGVDIEVMYQYAESYSDMTKGKTVAKKQYASGCDIIFQCAGAAGLGVIEEAKSCGKYVIGVDKDQYSLAPENVLTSALKNIDKAMLEVSEKIYNNEEVGGKNFNFGLSEGITGIPSENPNLSSEIIEQVTSLKGKIQNGEICIPTDRESYLSFAEKLSAGVN